MPTLKQHFFSILAAIIIMAACGTFVGYQLAEFLAVRATENRLDRYASRILANGEATSTALRAVLDAVSASRYSTCASAEIDYFRTLIFAPDYLKDAGRMRNGTIECSAALGQSAQPAVQSIPDFTQQDGSILYRDLVPYRSNGLSTITVQRGDSFVVFTPLTRLPVEPPPMHYTETVTDAPTQTHGRLLGEPFEANARILTAEGRTRIGDNLYSTRCSTHFFNCITAYTSIPEVMKASRAKVVVFIGLFRLAGGLSGLGLALLFYRYKSVEQQLRRAIRRDELFLVYQPIVQLQSRRITGAEALARWTNKQGVEVSPEVFVKIAEEHGFVGAITKLVVRQALHDFRETLRSHPRFRLSINAAAADLADPEFLPMLNRAVDEAAVQARSLAIEITERSTVKRKEAIETIRGLRARGHSVHIDDFGTGYSSLSYLHNLSADAIKIDKTFTQAISTGSAILVIVPQILAMAEALKLQVTVEGIETEEQANYFESATQPILAQGWLFGRPVPAADFRCLLAEDEEQAQVAMQSS